MPAPKFKTGDLVYMQGREGTYGPFRIHDVKPVPSGPVSEANGDFQYKLPFIGFTSSRDGRAWIFENFLSAVDTSEALV